MSMGSILIVEDEIIVALDIKKKLEKLNYKVLDMVSTGEAAIEKLQSINPDLVLMDISLNGSIDGIEAARHIYSHFNIPIVYMTAHFDKNTLNRAKITDPFGYIVKPFDRRVLSITIDMAIHKHQMSLQLKEVNENFRHLAENASDGILIAAPDGNDLFANRRALHITGQSPSQLSELCLEHLIGTDEKGVLRENWAVEDFFDKRSEVSITRQEGKTISLELTGTKTIWHGQPALLVLLRDITCLKEAEEESNRLLAQLEQVRKMEALGNLAGGIAHDFNNILAIILGYTELAITDLPGASSIRTNLDKVLNASLRAKGVVAQILNFSRQTQPVRKATKISLILKEALKLLRSSLPATIEIRQSVQTNCDIALADPSQINQVIINLCSNAAHAMLNNGGILEITIDSVELGNDEAVSIADLAAGRFIRLTIRDTGHGIAPEAIQRIFDPYFTTKAVGNGSGMGLAAAHGIIKNHDGAVTVQSKLGKGSTFQVFLPLYEDTDRKTKMTERLPHGNERILFVDDEQFLLDMVRQMLESLGYQVVVKSNGIEALELFKKNPGQFDMVITDMTMPMMTGTALAKEMLRIKPSISIIICTGFSAQINKEEIRRIGVKAVLIKPIVMQDFAQTIREILDNR